MREFLNLPSTVVPVFMRGFLRALRRYHGRVLSARHGSPAGIRTAGPLSLFVNIVTVDSTSTAASSDSTWSSRSEGKMRSDSKSTLGSFVVQQDDAMIYHARDSGLAPLALEGSGTHLSI
jgi:hypothetical protein